MLKRLLNLRKRKKNNILSYILQKIFKNLKIFKVYNKNLLYIIYVITNINNQNQYIMSKK